jgi:hypothetical protein
MTNWKDLEKALEEVSPLKGGPGSGNHGHSGRPGQIGGSGKDEDLGGPVFYGGKPQYPGGGGPKPVAAKIPKSVFQSAARGIKVDDVGRPTRARVVGDGKNGFQIAIYGPAVGHHYNLLGRRAKIAAELALGSKVRVHSAFHAETPGYGKPRGTVFIDIERE